MQERIEVLQFGSRCEYLGGYVEKGRQLSAQISRRRADDVSRVCSDRVAGLVDARLKVLLLPSIWRSTFRQRRRDGRQGHASGSRAGASETLCVTSFAFVLAPWHWRSTTVLFRIVSLAL